MAVTIELWEDYGSPSAGRGSGTKKIYEATLSNEVPSASVPDYAGSHSQVSRPGTPGSYNYSYNRYLYLKCYGTYEEVSRVYWYVESASDFVTDLMYRTTNTYAAPINTNDSGTIIVGPTIIDANVSASGPNSATSFTNPTSNQTFYSDFLVLQSRVGYMDAVSAQFSNPVTINAIAVELGDY